MTYYFVIHTLKTQQNLAKYTKYAKEIVWFVNSWIRFNFSWNLLFGCWVLVVFCCEWSHKITIIATHHLLHLLQSWRTTFRSGRVSRIFHHRSFIHVMFLILSWKKNIKGFNNFWELIQPRFCTFQWHFNKLRRVSDSVTSKIIVILMSFEDMKYRKMLLMDIRLISVYFPITLLQL